MKPWVLSKRNLLTPVTSRDGSVLIIVMWVAFGLVTLALYFANSMSLELRASDNRAASLETEQAIAGAARYVSNVLASVTTPGALPDPGTYKCEAVPVGDATFWILGRQDQGGPAQPQVAPDAPVFGLVDEAAKLNLNARWVTAKVLALLPRMTPELAAAILDWRDSDEDVTQGGAESQTYARLDPPYRCKNANFESIDELRLVSGAYLDVLYGEDANLNGVLDPNENDGDVSAPADNRDGVLDMGLLDYVTVYSREPATTSNGTPRVDVSRTNNVNRLRALLDSAGVANSSAIIGKTANSRSVLEFYFRSDLPADQFAQIEDSLRNPNLTGLINVNTASEAVLACVPGLDADKAQSLVAYRQANAGALNAPWHSVAWVKEVLDRPSLTQAGPCLTGKTYQFMADVAAVGHHGRGYGRVKFIFDTSEGTPTVRYRQDLTHLGWALGRQTRDALLLVKGTP